MKNNRIIFVISIALIGLLASCSKKPGMFSYTQNAYHTKQSPSETEEQKAVKEKASVKTTISTSEEPEIAESPVITESNAAPKTSNELNEAPVPGNPTLIQPEDFKTDGKELNPKDKKKIRKLMKKASVNDTNIPKFLLVVIAVLLPPLAVLLVDGFGGPFWLSILLWLLLAIPGIIYALWRVLRAD